MAHRSPAKRETRRDVEWNGDSFRFPSMSSSLVAWSSRVRRGPLPRAEARGKGGVVVVGFSTYSSVMHRRGRTGCSPARSALAPPSRWLLLGVQGA